MNEYDYTGIQRRFFNRFVKDLIFSKKGNKCKECGSTENLNIYSEVGKAITIKTIEIKCRSCREIEKCLLGVQ